MGEKLTKAQASVLKYVAGHSDGYFCAWSLGTATCEALRERGLVQNGSDRPFTTRTRDNERVYITPAGLAALSEKDTNHERN